jgi:hypothetical protein
MRAAVAATMMAVSAGSVRTAAPAGEEKVRGRIPFSFTVNTKTLPPGTYTVSVDPAQGLLEVRDLTHGAFAISAAFDDRRTPDTKLVFHRYGDQYVLREVWMGGGAGRELPEPRRERELSAAVGGGGGKASARFERIEVPAL